MRDYRTWKKLGDGESNFVFPLDLKFDFFSQSKFSKSICFTNGLFKSIRIVPTYICPNLPIHREGSRLGDGVK